MYWASTWDVCGTDWIWDTCSICAIYMHVGFPVSVAITVAACWKSNDREEFDFVHKLYLYIRDLSPDS